MIPLLSPFILRLIGGRFKWLADLLAILLLVVIVIGGWKTWLHFHDRRVSAEYEASVQANVSVVTDKAQAKANADLKKEITDFNAQMKLDRKEIDDAKHDNRSPLDALFD